MTMRTDLTPLMEARELATGYGGPPVIQDVNISIRPGEVVALLGPNGAGKSTTLLALAGELTPSAGEVLMDGEPLDAPLYVRARRGLAFVPEERSVFRSMSCLDNLRVGRARAEVSLRLFPELEKRLHVAGGLLSGGEQQMLSLGRALSLEPRVLLVDELSLGLAPLMVKSLLRAVRRAADAGCGVLLVEQHVREAMAIADTVHVLRRGRIEVSGTREEMAKRIDEIERQYLSGTLLARDVSAAPTAGAGRDRNR